MSDVYSSQEGERVVRRRYLELLESWPVPHERRNVQTRQGETFVVASGPPGAPAVLLLHGSMTNALMWMGDVDVWARDLRVYAVDVIGEPGLSAPARPRLGSDGYAEWLDDVLSGLGLTSAAIVGASLGGWLATDYATRRPERVERLALLCPGGIGRQKWATLLLVLLLLPFGQWGKRAGQRFYLGLPPEAAPGLRTYLDYILLVQRHFRPRRESSPYSTTRPCAGSPCRCSSSPASAMGSSTPGTPSGASQQRRRKRPSMCYPVLDTFRRRKPCQSTTSSARPRRGVDGDPEERSSGHCGFPRSQTMIILERRPTRDEAGMVTSQVITVRRTASVAEIVLDRPGKLNAMNLDWVRELGAIVDQLAASPPRVVVISGNGRAFCSGIDLDMTTEQGMPPDFLSLQEKAFTALERLPAIVVAQIHGYCLGGGLQLALACDIRIAMEGTLLGLPAALEGLPPGVATWRLPRFVGMGRALRLSLSGTRVTAAEALDMGLVDHVVSDQAGARAIVDQYVRVPHEAAVGIKEITRSAFDLSFEAAFERTRVIVGECLTSPDTIAAQRAWGQR